MSKLKNITNQTGVPSDNEQRPTDGEAYFGLPEELFNPINLNVDSEEDEVGNCLQKLHIKNHAVASKEVVHDVFSEKDELVEVDPLMMSPEDEMLFEDIREAVAEKDLIDLRANLQSIAQGVSVHERTFEEIENFVSGELDNKIETLLREEAMMNVALSNEIELHKDINSAINEPDIMKLRTSLNEIIQNEYSHSRSIEEIDSYLNDELNEYTQALFEDELLVNPGLVADLTFHREVDRAIIERDVMALRASLQSISQKEQDRSSEKLGVASPKQKNLLWYAVASSIVLMFVFSSLIRHKTYTSQQLYSSYYQPYKNGASVSRSASASVNELNTALLEIDRGDYTGALKSLKSASAKEKDGFSVNFYSGVAYQELGEFKSAINSFSKVVMHGDNLLVEQSEWYIGLCYLRIEEREKAIAQLKGIVSRNGFYHDQSSKLLKQLE